MTRDAEPDPMEVGGVIILAFLVLCMFVPPLGRLVWAGIVVIAGLLLMALIALAWLCEVTWTGWRRHRARKREVLAAGRLALERKAPAGLPPKPLRSPQPVAGRPVPDPDWWDAIPDDAFVPPVGWQVRRKLRLPARALPQVETPGANSGG